MYFRRKFYIFVANTGPSIWQFLLLSIIAISCVYFSHILDVSQNHIRIALCIYSHICNKEKCWLINSFKIHQHSSFGLFLNTENLSAHVSSCSLPKWANIPLFKSYPFLSKIWVWNSFSPSLSNLCKKLSAIIVNGQVTGGSRKRWNYYSANFSH